jgi:AcrR family transcriptional regulator
LNDVPENKTSALAPRAPDAEQRRRRRRAEARRPELVAPQSLAVEGGAEAFSMRRLADRCGYTAPTIYHHFGDKPGLIRELMEERFGRLLERLRRVPRAADPAEYLRDLARAFVRFGLGHPTHYQLLTTPYPGAADPPESAEQARAFLEEPLARLARQGRLRITDVEAVVQSLWALTHGVISLQIHRPDYPWSGELLEVALEVFLHGLLRPRAPAGDTTE